MMVSCPPEIGSVLSHLRENWATILPPKTDLKNVLNLLACAEIGSWAELEILTPTLPVEHFPPLILQG